MPDGRSLDRVFWLGFPAILGLLWIHQHVRSVATGFVAYAVILVWILYCVQMLSRATPSNALLNTFARVYISMAFAGLVALGLIIAVNAGPAGYAAALFAWLALLLVVRAIPPWASLAREGRRGPNSNGVGDEGQRE